MTATAMKRVFVFAGQGVKKWVFVFAGQGATEVFVWIWTCARHAIRFLPVFLPWGSVEDGIDI